MLVGLAMLDHTLLLQGLHRRSVAFAELTQRRRVEMHGVAFVFEILGRRDRRLRDELRQGVDLFVDERPIAGLAVF